MPKQTRVLVTGGGGFLSDIIDYVPEKSGLLGAGVDIKYPDLQRLMLMNSNS